VYYISVHTMEKKNPKGVCVQLILFCFLIVGCLSSACGVHHYTQVPLQHKKGMFCVPLFVGFWGFIILNCFCCWRKWFALYYQIWETC